ncbi:MAG: TIGR02530 family flagellar biosynthesis protein [candidate division Zixibacteria bacterium]|jgi:flagellar operon protein|nr:TIGR02530 family flagellar biosynthesis protein [candidate division Zixibacteria bacterium]
MANALKISNYQRPVDLLEISRRGKQPTESVSGKNSFEQMFSQELAGSRGVTFSKHASERLYSRGIEIGNELMGRIAGAIDKAELKGSKETLILTDDAALVVSVKNRTVITAFDRENLREGVVTSIDSAVIL